MGKSMKRRKNIELRLVCLNSCCSSMFFNCLCWRSYCVLNNFFFVDYREKPYDVEWYELVKLKNPLLLNYAQCKLLVKEYYAVIEHCSEVIQHEPNNVKALYRRAKGHIGAWNPDEAKKDLLKCLELDETLKTRIQRDLNDLNEQIKKHETKEKEKFQKMFSTNAN